MQIKYTAGTANVTAGTLYQKEYTVSELGLTGKTIIGVVAVLRYFPGNSFHKIDVSSLYSAAVGFRVQVCSDYTGEIAYDMYVLYK